MHRNKYKTGQIIGSIGGLGKNERKGEQTAPFSRYFAFGRIGVFGSFWFYWIIHRFLSSCRRVCRRVFRLLLLLQMLNQKKVAARRGWRNSALFVIRRRGWLVASCRRYRSAVGLASLAALSCLDGEVPGLGWASVASEGKGWRTPFPCKLGERSEHLSLRNERSEWRWGGMMSEANTYRRRMSVASEGVRSER